MQLNHALNDLMKLFAIAFLAYAAATPSAADNTSSIKTGALHGMEAVKAYCSNIRDLAKDARYRRQFNELTKLSKEIDAKVVALRSKIAEYKKWYDLRQKFSKQATESLVRIYSRMRPDSAAAQLSEMNQLAAAALIIKLDTRVASAILNEIKPAKAASLSGIIAAAARRSDARDPS